MHPSIDPIQNLYIQMHALQLILKLVTPPPPAPPDPSLNKVTKKLDTYRLAYRIVHSSSVSRYCHHEEAQM
jgi:hypothetical protein